MKPHGTRIALVGIITAVVASLALVAPANSANTGKKVFWVDMYYTIQQKPDFVYFTANAGGQVNSIKWTGWGKKKAIGKGIFHDSSPSFPGKLNQEGPAKLVAWKPVKCTLEYGSKKGKTIRVYRHVMMQYKNGKGGKKWVNISHHGGWLTCKES